MALSAAATFQTRLGRSFNAQVKTSSVVYSGALLMYTGNSGVNGAVGPYDGTVGAVLAGWAFGDLGAPDGNGIPTGTTYITGNTAGAVPPVASIHPGGIDFIIENVAVAGLGNTVIDQGKIVYATDDGTYTVTSPSTHMAQVGYIAKGYPFRASGYADIQTKYVLGTVGS